MKKWITNRYLAGMLAISCCVMPVLESCKNHKYASRGGAIGAGVGGVAGGAIGAGTDHTVLGAIIGAAIGGAAGAAIGNYMDKQAEEIRNDVKGARVERIAEGIRITFDTGILFDINSYTLKDEAKANIKELARVLQKYDDTNILIEGHTDNTGSDDLNMKLSVHRANAVADFAKSLGVGAGRIITRGYGESQPIDSNDTEAGRQNNRRVEVAIMANKKLQKAAKRGDI